MKKVSASATLPMSLKKASRGDHDIVNSSHPVNFPWKLYHRNKSRAIFIRDLPFHCRSDDLRTLLQNTLGSECIEDVIIWCGHQSKTLQVACALLREESQVATAISILDNHRLDGRDIKVGKYNPNVSFHKSPKSTKEVRFSFLGTTHDIPRVSEAMVRDAFETNYGPLSHVCIRSHRYSPEGKQGGFGFLTFVNDEHADSAVETIRHFIVDRVQFDCSWSTPPRTKLAQDQSSQLLRPSTNRDDRTASFASSDRGDTTTEGSRITDYLVLNRHDSHHTNEEIHCRSYSMENCSTSSTSRLSLDISPMGTINGDTNLHQRSSDSVVSELAEPITTTSSTNRRIFSPLSDVSSEEALINDEYHPASSPYSERSNIKGRHKNHRSPNSKIKPRRVVSEQAILALTVDCEEQLDSPVGKVRTNSSLSLSTTASSTLSPAYSGNSAQQQSQQQLYQQQSQQQQMLPQYCHQIHVQSNFYPYPVAQQHMQPMLFSSMVVPPPLPPLPTVVTTHPYQLAATPPMMISMSSGPPPVPPVLSPPYQHMFSNYQQAHPRGPPYY